MATKKTPAPKRNRGQQGPRAPARARGPEWWTPKRQGAYALLLTGEHSVADVALKVGIGREELWRWRQHEEWRAKLKVDRERAATAYEERLLGIDDEAVGALRAHVKEDPKACISYLMARGVLAEATAPMSEDEKRGREIARSGIAGADLVTAIRVLARMGGNGYGGNSSDAPS